MELLDILFPRSGTEHNALVRFQLRGIILAIEFPCTAIAMLLGPKERDAFAAGWQLVGNGLWSIRQIEIACQCSTAWRRVATIAGDVGW